MPTLTTDPKGNFVWRGTFHDRLLPKEAKFRWNPTDKVWWTDDAVKAHALIDYADPEATDLINKGSEFRLESAAASRAVDADIDIPCPEDLEYRPFQKAGIAYALQHPSTMIGDDMGLGKTIQAIGVINADAAMQKVLVVCLSGLRLNWRHELTKWLTRDMTIGIMEGKDKALPDTDIVIISYGIVSRKKSLLKAFSWDALIIDESHYLKNDGAQRTKALLTYWDRKQRKTIQGVQATRKIFLTGTPMVNRPKELWTQYNNLAPELFKSFMYFMKRYCAAKQETFGWNFNGASNLGELQQKAREQFLIRRKKADVLKELPAKVRQIIELPKNGAFHVVNRDQKALKDLTAQLAPLERAVTEAKDSGDPVMYAEAVADLESAESIAFEEMAAVRHETATAKIPACIKHIESCLKDGRKLVVFAHHHDVIDAISQHFQQIVVQITGMTSLKERDRAVRTFQTDPKATLFVGNIQAAGVGHTLTAASHVIFCELDWAPGNVSQAEDRCHRIGQEDSVLIQHLVFSGTIDSKMAKTLVAKQEVFDSALDTEVEGHEL